MNKTVNFMRQLQISGICARCQFLNHATNCMQFLPISAFFSLYSEVLRDFLGENELDAQNANAMHKTFLVNYLFITHKQSISTVRIVHVYQ